jgi:hypothetical protein
VRLLNRNLRRRGRTHVSRRFAPTKTVSRDWPTGGARVACTCVYVLARRVVYHTLTLAARVARHTVPQILTYALHYAPKEYDSLTTRVPLVQLREGCGVLGCASASDAFVLALAGCRLHVMYI